MIGPGFGESDKYLRAGSGQAANRVQPFEVSWDPTPAHLLLWPANKHEQLSEAVAKKSAVYVRISKNIELSKLREAELQEVV